VTPSAKLTWFDRSARTLNEIGEVRRYIQIALAPDGPNVATAEEEPGISFSVFQIEPARNIHTRLTTGGHYDPVWSPDGREIAFASEGRVFQRKSISAGRRPLSLQGCSVSKIGRTTAVS
jgi:hypothetical protein